MEVDDPRLSTPRAGPLASMFADSPISGSSSESPKNLMHDNSLLTAITDNESLQTENEPSSLPSSSVRIIIQERKSEKATVALLPYHTVHVDPVKHLLPITCTIGSRFNNPKIYRDRQGYYEHSASQKYAKQVRGPEPRLVELFSNGSTRDVYEKFDQVCIFKGNRSFRPEWVKRQVSITKKNSHPVSLISKGLFIQRRGREATQQLSTGLARRLIGGEFWEATWTTDVGMFSLLVSIMQILKLPFLTLWKSLRSWIFSWNKL